MGDARLVGISNDPARTIDYYYARGESPLWRVPGTVRLITGEGGVLDALGGLWLWSEWRDGGACRLRRYSDADVLAFELPTTECSPVTHHGLVDGPSSR